MLSISTAINAGNVYCPWNEWGSAAGAHEDYGTEMQKYLLGEVDADTLLDYWASQWEKAVADQGKLWE